MQTYILLDLHIDDSFTYRKAHTPSVKMPAHPVAVG